MVSGNDSERLIALEQKCEALHAEMATLAALYDTLSDRLDIQENDADLRFQRLEGKASHVVTTGHGELSEQEVFDLERLLARFSLDMIEHSAESEISGISKACLDALGIVRTYRHALIGNSFASASTP